MQNREQLSAEKLKSLFQKMDMLNDECSPVIINIEKITSGVLYDKSDYECQYCDESFSLKKLRDLHVSNSHTVATTCFLANVMMLKQAAKNLQFLPSCFHNSVEAIANDAKKLANSCAYDTKVFYFNCILALETIVCFLLKEYGYKGGRTEDRLEEHLIILKDYVKPPSRLNFFYAMKNLIGDNVHLIYLEDNSEKDINVADKLVICFRLAIDAAVDLFEEIKSLPQSSFEAIKDKNKRERNEKRKKMCKDYNSKSGCQFGDQCKFLHTNKKKTLI